MKKQFLKFSAILLLLNLFVLFAAAQEKSNVSVPDGLVLEVKFFKDRQPAYQKISKSGGWSWYSLFQKIPNWQPPAGMLPVQSVYIVPRFENDIAKVKISVFTGKDKFREKDVFVAEYSLRENERQTIKELADFGIEPFELAVVRLAPNVSELPVVDNQTKSLQVNVEPLFDTLPAFKVVIINNSEKAVGAVFLETNLNGRKSMSGMPQGREGNSLIVPGGTYEKKFPSSPETNQNKTGESPVPRPNLTLVVPTVVFADGTFEGNRAEALTFLGFKLGDKMWLQRSVPMLRKAAEGGANPTDLNKLIEQISALSEEIDETAYNEWHKQLSAPNEKERASLRSPVSIGLRAVKRTMLSELQELLNSSNQDAGAIRGRLTEMKNKYQNWLTRVR